MKHEIIEDREARLYRVVVDGITLANYETKEAAEFWGWVILGWYGENCKLTKGKTLPGMMHDLEHGLLLSAMEEHESQEEAAKWLGLKRTTYQYRLKIHGLENGDINKS